MDTNPPYMRTQRPARRTAPDGSNRFTPDHNDSWEITPQTRNHENPTVEGDDHHNYMPRKTRVFKIAKRQHVRNPGERPTENVTRERSAPVQDAVRPGASEPPKRFRHLKPNAKPPDDNQPATKDKKGAANRGNRKSLKNKNGKNGNGKKDTKISGRKVFVGRGPTGKIRSNIKRTSKSSTMVNRFPYARRPLTVWTAKAPQLLPKPVPLRSKASMYNAALNLSFPTRASPKTDENAPPRRILPIIQFKNSLGLAGETVEHRDAKLPSVDKGTQFKTRLGVKNEPIMRRDNRCRPVTKLLATIKQIQALSRPTSGIADLSMPKVPPAPKPVANSAQSCDMKAKEAYLRTRELCRRRSADPRSDFPGVAGANLNLSTGKLERRMSEVFKCDQCPCEFLFKSSLDAHQRVCHKDEKCQETATVVTFADNPTSTVTGGQHQCKYCDKKLALLTALHIHQLKYCVKIPAKDRRNLNFTELDHVKKPPVPHMSRSRHSIKLSTPAKRFPTVDLDDY